MPPTAKKYKVKEAAAAAAAAETSPDKSTTVESSPEKTVVSGQLQKALSNKRKGKYRTQRGVVYVKNLPHGFFEDQLQKYFQQFGKVTRVRLARSPRNGGSKGFAFVEFSVPEVAEIAAETMNNYLMFRKLVKAAYIPPNEQKYNYFKTSVRQIKNKVGKPVYVSYKTRAINRKMHLANNWSEENYAKRMKNTEDKIESMKRTFADVDFDFDSCVLKPETNGTSPGVQNGKGKSPAVSPSTGSEGSAAQPKIKKQKSGPVTVESLLDATIDEDEGSSDDDYIPDSVVQPKIKKQKSGAVTVESLLEATIDEDEGSSDDDYIPDDQFAPSEEEDDDESGEEDEDSSPGKSQKEKTIPLKRLLEDTIEEDSDDDDFDPESDDESAVSDDDDDDDSPQKSVKKALGKLLSKNKEQSKLEKMIQRKPHSGGINKKSKSKKQQQPAKSQALREKIQESVKEMSKQKQVGRVKPKAQKKAGKGRT